MLRLKMTMAQLAVIAAVLTPMTSMSQGTRPGAGCKRTYVACVQALALTEQAARYQCVKQYQQCLDSATHKQNPTIFGGVPTQAPKTPTTK